MPGAFVAIPSGKMPPSTAGGTPAATNEICARGISSHALGPVVRVQVCQAQLVICSRGPGRHLQCLTDGPSQATDFMSPQFRRDGLNCRGKLFVQDRIHRAMANGCARRIIGEMVATSPVLLRPDRSWTKAATAIRADIFQDGFSAGTAESALEGTNHRFRRIGRKPCIAILAGRS